MKTTLPMSRLRWLAFVLATAVVFGAPALVLYGYRVAVVVAWIGAWAASFYLQRKAA